jgi:hypothetical protein
VQSFKPGKAPAYLPTLDAFRTFAINMTAGMLLAVPSRTCTVAGGAA